MQGPIGTPHHGCQLSVLSTGLTYLGRGFGAEADRSLRHELSVCDSQRAYPSLTAGDIADKRSEFDEFCIGEMSMKLFPHRVICARWIPTDRVGVPQRDPLALGEEWRRLELIEAFQLVLGSELFA